jgi:hypothetical protein
MPVEMTHRQRVLGCVRWNPIDRVPIYSPVPFDPFAWERGELHGWQDSDNYRAVAALAAEHCEVNGRYRRAGGLFSRVYHMIPDRFIEHLSRETVGDRTTVTTLVHTPKGDLRTVVKHDRNVSTAWCAEPLIKDSSDVDRLLSVPFEPNLPDPEAFEQERRAYGERGMVELGISTPMVCTSHLMIFHQFLEWCASERALIIRLIEAACERICVRLEHLLKAGVIDGIWLGGSEQATPPMMSREFYDDLVVPYDGRITELVHRYGALVHVHCHGKVNGVFERMMDLGADMLDPVEPPPDGDIEIGDAKRRARRRMVLMGNIEFRHLEFATRQEIDELVRRALCEQGKAGIMLYPSATPITYMSDQLRDNCIQYIESGLKYGGM